MNSRSRSFKAAIHVAIALLLVASHSVADTVTTVDNVSCNGTTLSLDGEYLRFSSKNPDKTELYVIPRNKIRVLEFNQTSGNLRAPHGPFLAHEQQVQGDSPLDHGKKHDRPKVSAASQDTVYLLGGTHKVGHVLAISSEGVKLDGSGLIPKFRVASIEFAVSQ